jgi:hypothetical protein
MAPPSLVAAVCFLLRWVGKGQHFHALLVTAAKGNVRGVSSCPMDQGLFLKCQSMMDGLQLPSSAVHR